MSTYRTPSSTLYCASLAAAMAWLLAASAFALPAKIPVTPKNQHLFMLLPKKIICYSAPNGSVAGGKFTKEGKQRYFVSAKAQLKQLIRSYPGGKVPMSKRLHWQRAAELVQEQCDSLRGITDALSTVLGSAQDPWDALYGFINRVLSAREHFTDKSAFMLTAEEMVLESFQDKTDFDALFTLMQRVDDWYDIESFIPASSDVPVTPNAVDCLPPHDVNLYRIDGGTNNIVMELLHSIFFYLELSASTTDIPDVRHFFNRDLYPASTGEPLCRLFVGPASQPLIEAERNPAINQLPVTHRRLAAAYQRAYNRCLQAYGVPASSAQTTAGWLADAAAYVPSGVTSSKLRTLIEQDITSGRQVILFGHGLGNVFANAAANAISPDTDGARKPSVGIIAVAPSKSYTNSLLYGGYFEELAAGDLVTQLPGAPAALASNDLSAAAPIARGDYRFAVHDFGWSYLYYSSTLQPLLTKTTDMTHDLLNGREGMGQGFFQVTLEWNIAGDIDLHAFEPTGTHVYWEHKQGLSGQLDRDDRWTTGPENYYVCRQEQMQPGNYSVSVNNYAGTAGTTARVTIRAKSRIMQYNVTMIGYNAGQILQPVALVTYNANGRFTITDARE